MHSKDDRRPGGFVCGVARSSASVAAKQVKRAVVSLVVCCTRAISRKQMVRFSD